MWFLVEHNTSYRVYCLLGNNSIDLVEFNYKKPSFIKRLVGIGGGTQEVINQEVKKITIDQISLENVEIEFGDIQADLGINGFIGTDVLRHFDINIKFSTKELYLKQH